MSHGAGVSLMLTLMDIDESPDRAITRYYRTEHLAGASPSYAHLLTAVLTQLHSSKFSHEYDVHGICNPFLQVKARSRAPCRMGHAVHCSPASAVAREQVSASMPMQRVIEYSRSAAQRRMQ
jgi:hypothetical protein